MTDNLIIREGTRADLPGLLALVKELADYEKAAGEVEVTVEQLEYDGFGPEKIFGFFVAENNDELAGIALWYFKYSTWKGKCVFLEDIVVREALRGQGIGKLLFDEIVKLAARHHCKRIEWQVLNWNTPAIEFYKRKYGADISDEWLNGRLIYKQIQEIAANLEP